jgi:excisionase family DNA binding protein
MPPTDPAPALRGLTIPDMAKRYRVGRDTVRGWIARGELRATNTAPSLCGRARCVVTPEALADFERRRAAGPQPKPARRRKRTVMIDYYPDP